MKQKLEALYKKYNTIQDITDPVNYPASCTRDEDKEIAAFLAALFAFGNVKQIKKAVEKIAVALGERPAAFLLEADEDIIREKLNGIYHRFYTEKDVFRLIIGLREVLKEYGSLEHLFASTQDHMNLNNSINLFHKQLAKTVIGKNERPSYGIRFMFPDAARGSACKRTNLFLRWMVRKDNVDFGLWNCLTPDQLIIPLDTHIARIGALLGFTARKQLDWKMAEEITAALRKFHPADPVRYDFGLCHIGIEKSTGILQDW